MTSNPIEIDSSILDVLAAGILVFRDNQILYTNAAIEQLTGYTQAELHELPITKLLHSDFHPLIREVQNNRHNRVQAEVCLLAHNAQPLYVSLTLATANFDGAPAQVATLQNISAYLDTEQQLRQRNEELELTLRHLPAVLFSLDTQGNVVHLSEHSARDLLLNHPTAQFAVQETLHGQHISTTIEQNGEFFDLWISPVYSPEGHLSGATGIGINVTDEKHAEAALQASEARQRALLNNIPDSIISVNRMGRILSFKPSLDYGMTPESEDYTGRTIWEVFPPIVADHFYQNILAALDLGEMQIGEYQMFSESGVRQRETRFIAYQRDTVLILGRDITDRKNAELELLESNLFVQKILDTVPDVIYVYERDNIESLHMTSQLEAVLGYTVDDFIALGDRMGLTLVHPEDYGEFAKRSTYWDDTTNGEILEMVYRFKHKSGEWRWIRCRERVFARNEDNIPQQIIGVLQDVTDYKRGQEALIRQETLEVEYRQEKRMSNLRNQIIDTISHEFRTPLSIILNASEILERHYDRLDDAKREKYVMRIKEQINVIIRMLEDVDNLSQRNPGKHSFKPAPINLASLCKIHIKNLQHTWGSDHILIYSDTSEDYSIFGDEQLLNAMLLRLLDNAIKYSESGTQVKLTLSRSADNIVLTVQDHGIGIPADELMWIYEPFFRGKHAQEQRGTGLGMTIVKNCIDAHHGRISVHSIVDQGTTFTITLPV